MLHRFKVPGRFAIAGQTAVETHVSKEVQRGPVVAHPVVGREGRNVASWRMRATWVAENTLSQLTIVTFPSTMNAARATASFGKVVVLPWHQFSAPSPPAMFRTGTHRVYMEGLPDDLLCEIVARATVPSPWPWTRLVFVSSRMHDLCVEARADISWWRPHQN